jgi:hypothetical protein
MTRRKLSLVTDQETVERTFGSRSFIRLSRNPALQSPTRFEPAKRVSSDDVWI